MDRTNDEITQLVAAGRQRQAGELLVRAFSHDVYGLCRSMARDDGAAQDLTQDVFTRAFQGLASYRGEASPRTWLLTIARHRCIDYLRQRRREPFDPLEPEELAHPAAAVSDLLAGRDLLRSALDVLSEGDRALVVLRHGHGVGYDELADAFGLRPGAVRMRVSRALVKMREHAMAPGSAGAPPPRASGPAFGGLIPAPTPAPLFVKAPDALVERLLQTLPTP